MSNDDSVRPPWVPSRTLTTDLDESMKNSSQVLVTSSADNFLQLSKAEPPKKSERDFRFWMCILAVTVSSFLMVLDLSGIGTVLPIIVRDLHGRQFEWLGSAYALSATAFLPLSGALSQVFGRRLIMLLQIFLFAVGSAMCGAAPSINVFIAGRTVQGIGAGGITGVTQIILADLVPLHDRGTFNGLVALSYCFGNVIAPVIAGALAQNGQWRWFFYMNLPICGVTAAIVAIFLKLKVPHGTFKDKIQSLDWFGNSLVIAATTAVVIGLTWGGIEFSWSSAQVLVPLILGLAGLSAFMIYEDKVPKMPLVPLGVLSTRTGISGYVQAFFTNFYFSGTIYYLPTYFQACRFATPIRSGVDMFGLAFTAMPFGLIAGVSVAKTGRYRPQLWLAWISLMVAGGLLSTLNENSNRASYIGFQVVIGLGLGITMTTTFFPVLAPLSVSLNASALAFFMFVRFFSQVWGVTIGGTILQNELQKRLPAEFLAQFPSDTAVAYSIMPVIATLQEPFRTEVRKAFADSLRVFWQVLIGVGALGFITSLFMKGLPLHGSMDEEWGLKEEQRNAENNDVEMH